MGRRMNDRANEQVKYLKVAEMLGASVLERPKRNEVRRIFLFSTQRPPQSPRLPQAACLLHSGSTFSELP